MRRLTSGGPMLLKTGIRAMLRAMLVTGPLGIGPLAVVLGMVLMLGAMTGCEAEDPDRVFAPARLLFVEAETKENQGLYADAIIKYEKITAQFPGTRLAAFAYLKLAEIYSLQKEWNDAETNYRLFLARSANSHLTPYLLYRLLKVNYEKSFTGLIFRERESDRDTEPNRRIMLEYKRFYLLYPKSAYLKEVTPIFRGARQTLAYHERMVADFYYDRGQFNAAIGRYTYLLRNFPEFEESEAVLKQLIRAYRKNQQPQFAEELERLQTVGADQADGGGAPPTVSRP